MKDIKEDLDQDSISAINALKGIYRGLLWEERLSQDQIKTLSEDMATIKEFSEKIMSQIERLTK